MQELRKASSSSDSAISLSSTSFAFFLRLFFFLFERSIYSSCSYTSIWRSFLILSCYSSFSTMSTHGLASVLNYYWKKWSVSDFAPSFSFPSSKSVWVIYFCISSNSTSQSLFRRSLNCLNFDTRISMLEDCSVWPTIHSRSFRCGCLAFARAVLTFREPLKS